MKAKDVIQQLAAVLPKHTSYFSDSLSISSLTAAAGTVTGVTPAAHGLAAGALVTITGAKVQVVISSLTQTGGVATAVTAANHDLTEDWTGQVPSDSPTVEISGASEAGYNGTHALLSVPNRRTFTFSVDAVTVSPDTGSPELLEQPAFAYNGQHQVTVVDATTFTYAITGSPSSPAAGTPVLHKGFRISGAVSVDAAQEAYTDKPSGELWAFVVLEDVVANKSRHIYSDATDQVAPGDAYRQRLIKPFSVFVFIPSTDSIGGREARDIVEDLELPLFKALLRKSFPEQLAATQQFGVTFLDHGLIGYNHAYYVHKFTFGTIVDVVYEDTLDPEDNVAFRDITFNVNDELGTTELIGTVNLDDVPL